MQETYADLEIRILEKRDEGYPVDITLNHEQQFGPGYLDPGFLPWVPSASPGDDGQRLFDWLFADGRLKEAWAEVRGSKPQRRVRLWIDNDVPELHALPWELLRDEGEGGVPQHLAAATATPFSRYLAGRWQPGSPILKRPIRVLVAVANPENLGNFGLEAIDLEKEWEVLQEATEGVEVELVHLPQPCTLPALQEELQVGYHVLHLVAHGAYRGEQAVLFLADGENQVNRVPEEEFAAMLGHELADTDMQNEDKLRLVFLASCQTATRSPADAFRGFAPALVEAHVPVVLAMQDLVSVETAREFARSFYGHLLQHGLANLAANQARSRLLAANLPGAAIPVLFMRLENGRLLDTPRIVAARWSSPAPMWKPLLAAMNGGYCTPILGPGLTESLLGSRREIAQSWADTYEFPMADHDRENLPQVAQYLAVAFRNPEFPRDELERHVREELQRRYGDFLPDKLKGPGASLDDLVSVVGNWQSVNRPADPHRVLARLPLPLYITANYGNLLAGALRNEHGEGDRLKEPRVEICPWNDYVDQLPSVYDDDPDYEPSAQEPLVYHLFGNLQDMETIVLTEDDYFDYLIGVTKNRTEIPVEVTSALTNSALLFLGFRMDDWEFRVLLRTLKSLEGGNLRRKHVHVAVQIDPDESRILDLEGTQKFLERYLDLHHIQIYWGSVDDFVLELDYQSRGGDLQP